MPADVQDRDVRTALDASKEHWPSQRLAIFDGVFRARPREAWCPLHGMRWEVVQKEPDHTKSG